ncbi:MAG TPA: hypothetical protein VG433_10070 [Pirellulales bacterium]|jgi:hypothetical protein|nr:hypothetical protein [Pirellulales bacterium]
MTPTTLAKSSHAAARLSEDRAELSRQLPEPFHDLALDRLAKLAGLHPFRWFAADEICQDLEPAVQSRVADALWVMPPLYGRVQMTRGVDDEAIYRLRPLALIHGVCQVAGCREPDPWGQLPGTSFWADAVRTLCGDCSLSDFYRQTLRGRPGNRVAAGQTLNRP